MNLSKIIALLIYLFYVVLIGFATENLIETLKLSVIIFTPALLILFPEQFGSYLGPAGRGAHINVTTPAFLVSFFGWLFFVGPPLFIFSLRFFS